MPRNDASQTRQNRINEIAKQVGLLFAKHRKDIPLDRLLAWISVNIGLTHETALKYLEDICEMKGWILGNNEDHKFIHNPAFDKEEKEEEKK
jgi:hypothetical protein